MISLPVALQVAVCHRFDFDRFNFQDRARKSKVSSLLLISIMLAFVGRVPHLGLDRFFVVVPCPVCLKVVGKTDYLLLWALSNELRKCRSVYPLDLSKARTNRQIDCKTHSLYDPTREQNFVKGLRGTGSYSAPARYSLFLFFNPTCRREVRIANVGNRNRVSSACWNAS